MAKRAFVFGTGLHDKRRLKRWVRSRTERETLDRFVEDPSGIWRAIRHKVMGEDPLELNSRCLECADSFDNFSCANSLDLRFFERVKANMDNRRAVRGELSKRLCELPPDIPGSPFH